ncbi:MAG: HAD-IB family hydrolase [Chlamydiae bacterium CG10_big_fil_rev_8_21_14_0_10_35_9]|nr:MAG: HAD-IB family hydrolase [Chlamydiae bacterium CG10_big_fil_rev_8_21_14_0_10_35_9]
MQVVVFDLDNTLIKGNISFSFFLYLFLNKKISLSRLFYPLIKFAKYHLGLLSLVDMHRLIFENFLKKQSLNFLKANVEPFLKAKIKKIINTPVYNHLKHHLKEKNHVILMSSSPDFLVNPLAEILGIKNSYATSYLLDSLGRISDVNYFLEGMVKAQFLDDHLKIDKLKYEKIVGFSDSINDLPLLKKCDEVYLVNPKRKLTKKFDSKICKII